MKMKWRLAGLMAASSAIFLIGDTATLFFPRFVEVSLTRRNLVHTIIRLVVMGPAGKRLHRLFIDKTRTPWQVPGDANHPLQP